MTAQDLKNSILQRAMQGKLVEQRTEEGTAIELIKNSKFYGNGKEIKEDETFETMLYLYSEMAIYHFYTNHKKGMEQEQ